jgi:uncharacterized protein (TIGR02147 family)
MSKIDLYQFRDYRKYLRLEFAGTGPLRGRRTQLAKHLRCQTSFLSQVFTDRAHLSLEHAVPTSEFLNHTPSETKFFMALVQKARAGSKSLEHYFDEEIALLLSHHDQIQSRIPTERELGPEAQMTYYSTWYFSAIHVLCALPKWQTAQEIAVHLKLEIQLVKEVLLFLEKNGFVVKKAGSYQIGATRLHLPKGSPMLPRHHSNWRMKAIDSVDQEKPQDLHYSAVLGISKKDQAIFREKILSLIEEFEPIVRSSKEEIPVILLFDLFNL